MVVCGPSVLPGVPVSCSVTPVIQPYSPGLCPVSPVSAVPCQPRFPTATIIPNGQIMSAPQHMTQSDVTQPQYGGQNIPTAVLSAPIPFPYHHTMPPQSAMVPYTCTTVPSAMPCNPVNGSGTTTVYNGMTTIVAANHTNTTPVITCGPRIFGHESCPSGLCPMGTQVLSGPAPICPTIPTTTILPNSARICQISPNVLTVPTWKQSYGMEQVWQFEFKTLFSQYSPHVWLLLPINQTPPGLWNANVDSAKVRFCCEDCGHGWTSMKGRVAFWFYLNPSSGEGVVCLKLYGQQCDRCKTGNYEPAMWYPEEVIKVLVNIYNKVGQIYYGFQQAPYHRTRRPGKPRTPHNSELCQACKDGVCSERR